MAAVEELITENIDIWTSALEQHHGSNRGRRKKNVCHGIKLLRRLILQLAIEGKLIAQNVEDKSVQQTLNHPEILARKTTSGKGVKVDLTKPVSETEANFQIPSNWEWTRLGKIVEVSGGSQPPKAVFINEPRDGYTRLIQIRDFKSENFPTYVPNEYANRPFHESDVMIGRYGPPVFQILKGKRGTYNVALMKATPVANALSNEYLFILLSEPGIQDLVVSESERTAGQSGVRKELIYSYPVALPPFEEQHRIVAKVDELMALCDQLEQQTESSLTAHKTLVQTLLSALTQAAATLPKNDRQTATDAPTPFTQAWNRLAEHFDTVFTTEDSIEQLKQTILQLAVMGKLVPQDPNDEPASELLKRIAVEKAELVKAKKIKKQKALPEIGEEEMPFDLPDGWSYSRFGEIASTRLGKMLDKAKNKGNERPYLRNTNVQWQRFELDDLKIMRIEESEEEELRLLYGDLLICEGGEPGRCAIWRNQTSEMYFQKALHRARPFAGVLSEYLELCLKLDATSGSLKNYFTGATIQHFVGAKLSLYVVPLPPVSEQSRIVSKIEEIMVYSEHLKAQFKLSQIIQLQLADAVTEQAITTDGESQPIESDDENRDGSYQ